MASFFILLQILLSLKHVPMQHYQWNKCDKSDGLIKVDSYAALSQWTSDSWKHITAYRKNVVYKCIFSKHFGTQNAQR